MMDCTGDSMGVQSLQDIENYLANFNKEISSTTLYTTDTTAIYPPDTPTRLKLERSNDSNDATSPVNQPDQPGFESDSLLALHGTPVGATPVGLDTVEEQEEEDEDDSSPTTEQPDDAANYQTVTIVPSEVNQSGEVSYVLIVSQQDDKLQQQQEDEEAEDEAEDANDDNADLSVYDFKEEAKAALTDGELKTPTTSRTKMSRRSMPSYGDVSTSLVGGAVHLMCNYCNYTSPKRYLLARHMKAHSEERPHKCSICSRTFKTIPALQNHVNTHTGVRPQHCKECEASFTTSGELVRHVRYRHTYEKPHRCTECDYASVELSKLRRHIRSHTGERPYGCPHCAYASPDTYKLKRHLRTHTGEKPYLCDICQMRFTQSNSLKAHKLIHTGEKPVFQCELCPTTCGRKTDLKYHVMKLHTSDRPLLCRKCGKAFPDRYTYKIHLKTHDGEKCFRCELCPYSALDQRHLESHILTHTGQKPYNCQYCDHSFRQKQLLRRHINLYHVPGYVPPAPRDKIHSCPSCQKMFAHRGNLLRHLTMHDPDNIEYEEAMKQGDASTGEEEEEEDGEFLQLDDNAAEAVQLTEIDADQMQVQLVRVEGQEGEQVYIQIGDQMEMLTQQQARQVQEQAGLLLGVDSAAAGQDDDSELQQQQQQQQDAVSDIKQEKKSPRGRPRKHKLQDSDDDYSPVTLRSPGRGRGRGRGRPAGQESRRKQHSTSQQAAMDVDELDEN